MKKEPVVLVQPGGGGLLGRGQGARRSWFTARSWSRRCFWILPAEVRGNSATKSKRLGTLYGARRARQKAVSSAGAGRLPSAASWTKARPTSPHFGSASASTAASTIAGWAESTFSTSA